MTAKRKRATVYARSATGERDAIVGQLAQCQTWTQANGYTFVGEYSEVISGIAAHMPEQAKAVERASIEKTVLICTDPMRLSRNAGRLTDVMADCHRRGIRVHFVER